MLLSTGSAVRTRLLIDLILEVSGQEVRGDKVQLHTGICKLLIVYIRFLIKRSFRILEASSLVL